MATTFSRLYTHIVFSTKRREPLLTDTIRPKVWGYMRGIVDTLGCELLIANGWVEHAHLLVVRKPKVSESDLVRVVKSNSSRWIRESGPECTRFGWQDGFAAFSVSHSRINEARGYVANQESRHQRVSYEEEFLAILKKHDIAYDPKYVWDDDAVLM